MNFDDIVENRINGNASEEEGGANWMVTFADLLSLVLTFFVLLFSMSTVKEDEWDGVVESFAERLNPANVSQETPFYVAEFNISTIETRQAIDLDYLFRVVTEKISRTQDLPPIVVRRLDDRLVLSLPSDLLFAPGDAEIHEQYQSAIALLGSIISPIDNRVDVIGHSDPTPISTSKYPSNWELSLGRAMSIADMLLGAGYPHHINRYGLADSRYELLPKSVVENERNMLARRVDIEIRQVRVRD